MSDPCPRLVKSRGSPRPNRSHLKVVLSAANPYRERVSPPLSSREREVLSWLTRGSTNHQIAVALHVSPRTIEKHVERILAKLGATNRTVAALLAARASNL
jgi:DNA-binding NarL/FixJ family response regulator